MKKRSKQPAKPRAKRADHGHTSNAAAAVGPAGAAGETVPDEALGPAAALRQAEGEIGINEWLDPQTGEPAEGQSPPHLEED